MTDALPTAARRWLTVACLVGAFLGSMEVMVVSPVMPRVTAELGQAGLLPWVFTACILAQVVGMPVFGRLADTWGRRDAWLLGIGLFAAGTLLCALAPGMAVLIAGRVLQGAGGGALIPIALILFADLYPVEQRTRLQGLFSVVWGISSLVGPALGGGLTAAFGWRAVFLAPLPVVALTVALILRLLPRRLGQRAPDPAAPRANLVADLRAIYAHPVQQGLALSGLLLGAALLVTIAYLPIWLQAVELRSVAQAGVALIPFSLAWTVGSNLAGRLVPRLGLLRLLLLGEALTALGAAAQVPNPGAQAPLIAVGLGMGVAVAAMTVSSQEYAPAALRGQATSFTIFFRTIGQAVAAPLFGLLAGIRPDAADFSAVPHLREGLIAVFGAAAGLCALALLVSAAFVRRAQPRAPASAR